MSNLQNKIDSDPEKIVDSQFSQDACYYGSGQHTTDAAQNVTIYKRYVENGYIYEYYQKVYFGTGSNNQLKLITAVFVPGDHIIEELKK